MREKYDFYKIKSKPNPYAKSLWREIFKEAGRVMKQSGLTEKDVAEAIASYRLTKKDNTC